MTHSGHAEAAMTPERLDEIRRRAAAATSWSIATKRLYDIMRVVHGTSEPSSGVRVGALTYNETVAHDSILALLVEERRVAQDVPDLLAEVARLRSALARALCTCGPAADPEAAVHDALACPYVTTLQAASAPSPTPADSGADETATGDDLAAVLAQINQALTEPMGRGDERRVGKILTEATRRIRAERNLAQRLVSRLPMCPDHRDKFSPEQCQACRAEQAEATSARLREELGKLRPEGTTREQPNSA